VHCRPTTTLAVMSFSDLVSGGPSCGPSNPLQNLGKRFGQDRSSQMDRFDGDSGGEAAMRVGRKRGGDDGLMS
jgi:peroxin-5